MRLGYGITSRARSGRRGGVDGIGVYTQSLHDALQSVCPALEFLECEFPLSKGDSPDCHHHFFRNSYHVSYALARFGFDSFQLGGGAASLRDISLFHSPDPYIPQFRDIPVVATIHDAVPLTHPEWVSFRFRTLFRMLRSAKPPERVICISEFSANEVARAFRIPEERLRVVYNGGSDIFKRPVSPDVHSSILKAFGIDRPYFLYIGTLQPRKNARAVVDAYLSLPEYIRRQYGMVLIGRYGWGMDDLIKRLETREAREEGIYWLKYVSEEALVSLMRGCTSFVFPSLYEGFGIPVIEAFNAGVPVITSNVTSLPEIAGDAAVLVNPLDVKQISGAMESIVCDNQLAADLVARGLIRAEKFTWQRCAERTLDVYKELM